MQYELLRKAWKAEGKVLIDPFELKDLLSARYFQLGRLDVFGE